jgi:HD-GYP domain-containing protein (c-di-GMP phosphodiesterase class II)
MLRPRPHRPALTPRQASEELLAGCWTQFDGDVVHALLGVTGRPAAPVSAPSGAGPSWPAE